MTTILSTPQGGTGTATKPTAGQLLVGQANGTYSPTTVSTGVSSVTAGNTTLTISPTTGAVVASVNVAHNFAWTGEHTFAATSGVNPVIQINSATGTAAPVLEFRSNGSQVAYISDLGNTLFQNVIAAGGLGTDTIAAYNDPEIKTSAPIIPNSDNTLSIGKSGTVFNQVWSTTFYGNLQASNARVSGELELDYSTGALRFSGSNGKLNWQLQNGPSTSDLTWFWPQEVPGSNKIFQIDSAGVVTLIDAPSFSTPGISSVLATNNDASSNGIINTGSIYPSADNTYELGQSGAKWSTVWMVGMNGQSFVSNGTYTTGIGGTQNGTITITDGVITAIQEAIA